MSFGAVFIELFYNKFWPRKGLFYWKKQGKKMDFFQFLSQMFNKVDNVAILVLVAANGALLWMHVTWRKEEREDRRQLLDLVQENTKALNGVKLALAVMTGKNV